MFVKFNAYHTHEVHIVHGNDRKCSTNVQSTTYKVKICWWKEFACKHFLFVYSLLVDNLLFEMWRKRLFAQISLGKRSLILKLCIQNIAFRTFRQIRFHARQGSTTWASSRQDCRIDYVIPTPGIRAFGAKWQLHLHQILEVETTLVALRWLW